MSHVRSKLTSFADQTGWRTAHNPVNREILDFTDRHGMLVWNENRNLERQVIGVATTGENILAKESASLGSSVRRNGFHDVNGMWVPEKWKGVNPMYLNDAQAMVLRDRNHPSVIIWS
jgi:beta-galactosidase/beta-glucuronidase